MLALSGWAHARLTHVPTAQISLYSDGVHLTPNGTVAAIPAGESADYLPGSRVLARHANDPAAQRLAEQHRRWLGAADIPGAGTPYEPLVTDALLDIHVLTGAAFKNDDGSVFTSSPGAAVAGWSTRWRYVWPRDAAFVSAALATVGHVDDALDVLVFVQDLVTGSDGMVEDHGFHARYLPDGSGVPDNRGIQLDGNGWMLWAAGTLLAEIDEPARAAEAFARLRPLIDTATTNVLALTDAPPHLPPPSPDYWEISESSLTLGTAAPLLAGLEHAAVIYERFDDDGEFARAIPARAEQLRAAITAEFGSAGFRRYAERGLRERIFVRRNGRDAATAVLLPPFTQAPLLGAEEAWLASISEMARPAGGVAPGAGWRDDGVSWLPQTSLYALTAATTGHHDQAHEFLAWIDAHRTASGAIPEKVLADGSPAAVAPLTWAAANVVLAVAALETT